MFTLNKYVFLSDSVMSKVQTLLINSSGGRTNNAHCVYIYILLVFVRTFTYVCHLSLAFVKIVTLQDATVIVALK